MLLQSTILLPLLQHHHVSLSTFLSPQSGFRNPTTLRACRKQRHPIVKCSISQVHSYGTIDYERRPMINWNGVYRRITLMEDPDQIGAAIVLDECEREGKRFTKWELCRVVKQLRKFRRYKHALQIYEWMNNRAEIYRMSTSDIAIQLDLISKVHGALNAEDYFFKLPDTAKDKRTYGALLNTYAQAKMRDRAESLMNKMQKRGYATNSLPFNLMMTLYMNLKEYDKVDFVVSEMREKNVSLDLYSYNIWISSCGYEGSVEKMERVLEQMKTDRTINPNWSTFSTMATMYLKLGKMEKAESCLKMVESRITGRDRIPFHYLISLYSSVGNKEEVYRVWDTYKATFGSVLNLGYHTMILSLVRLGDIEGAEEIYKEWISVKSNFDPRIANVLMGWYVREGLMEKVQALFSHMIESGGKGNSLTWEILAEGKVKERRISEAVSCLKEAVLVNESKRWKPKPVNVSCILKLCEEENDMENKDVLMGMLRELGCFEDEAYMSYIIPSTKGVRGEKLVVEKGKIEEEEVDEVDDGDGAEMLLYQLQGSL